MAQQSFVSSEVISLLKTNDNGWKYSIFKDQHLLSEEFLCANCELVCCDAVELGCNHDDGDIYLYCNNCLSNLIKDGGNICPMDGHKNPIISPNRSIRRQILKLFVFCPNSVERTINDKKKKNNDNIHVVDTLGGNEEKEGFSENKINNDKHKCNWTGTLNELITKHFSDCIQKYDPSLIENIKLKNENKSLNEIVKIQNTNIDELNKEMMELKDELNDKNHILNQLRHQVKQLKSDIANNNNNNNNIDNNNTGNQAAVRQRLIKFYQVYNPEKLFDKQLIDELLTRYRGQEEQLFADLETKYIFQKWQPKKQDKYIINNSKISDNLFKISTKNMYAANWDDARKYVSQYDATFYSLSIKEDKASGAQIQNVMLQSSLPKDKLRKIWDLSNINKDGKMDKEEFALCMYLIGLSLNGVQLPDILPIDLVPPGKKHIVELNRMMQ